jgi:hypothetical protein
VTLRSRLNGFVVVIDATAAGPAEPALENNAKSSRHRSHRWEARGVLWDLSSINRLRKCGRVTVSEDGRVGVRADGNSVGFAGLSTCGSVWACPVCNSKIQNVRRLEIGVALANLHANGGGAAFGAVTVRHHAGQTLPQLLDGLTYGIARIARDRVVKRLRASMGYLGRIQALEITVGDAGWHPHRHPLLAFSRPVTPAEVSELHAAEFRAYRAGVVSRGLDAPTLAGQELRPVSFEGAGVAFSEYFTKSGWSPEGAGFEMTGAQHKRAKFGSRSSWELLHGIMRGDAEELELWQAYEQATRGKRALTYSRGLRDLLGIGAEVDDETIADSEVGDRDDTGFYVTDWAPVRIQPALGAGLLNAVGPAGDWGAGRDFCRRYGIPFEEV